MAKRIAGRAARWAYWPLTRVRRLLGVAGSAVVVLAVVSAPAAARAASSPVGASVLPSPSKRYEAAMDYDQATGNMVLFGGEKYGAVLGDTWTLSGAGWTRLSPAAKPPARGLAMMAYDPETSNMVLFGGQGNGTFLTGTWTWDGTTWTQQSPSPSPFPVLGAVMANDPATGNMVLFGGNASTKLISQTWTWNGTAWTQLSLPVHPSAREQGVMAYDQATGQLVLYGGSGIGRGGHGTCLHDTWTWNRTAWTKLSPPAHPQACFGDAMAYDQATGQLILFGGAQLGSGGKVALLNQTWTWNGTTWTELSPAAQPSARYGAAMAYDQATGQLVLFGGAIRGGKVSYGDTWTWDGTNWTQIGP